MADEKSANTRSESQVKQVKEGEVAEAAREDGLGNRRARLQKLKARRAMTGGGGATKPNRVAAERLSIAGIGAGEGGSLRRRNQLIMRVYKMLTDTPDDGSGMVPDTPFTMAGVTELMTTLEQRAANEGAPGAKVAAGVITFLKPSEGDEEVVSGASVTKLQLVARMISRFKDG